MVSEFLRFGSSSCTAVTIFLSSFHANSCSILLANGCSGARLEVYDIVSNRRCVLNPMKPDGTNKEDTNAAEISMSKKEVIISKTRNVDECDTDGNEIDHNGGFQWIITSPLECTMATCSQLLGVSQAVCIAGTPTINPEWLYDWSCEVADNVAHASVMIMEDALDTLHSVFPYYLVDWLIMNVVTSHRADREETSKFDDDATTPSVHATSDTADPPLLSVEIVNDGQQVGAASSGGYAACKVHDPASPSSTLSPDMWRSRSLDNTEDQSGAALDSSAMSRTKGRSYSPFEATQSSTCGSTVSIVSEWQHQQQPVYSRTKGMSTRPIHGTELSEDGDGMSSQEEAGVLVGIDTVDVFEPEIIGFEDLVRIGLCCHDSLRSSRFYCT